MLRLNKLFPKILIMHLWMYRKYFMILSIFLMLISALLLSFKGLN